MSAILLIGLPAYSIQDSEQRYGSATVVSVERYEQPSNYVGDNPADAPLRAREYDYDIGFRIGCRVYVGRYESAIQYLPSVFAPQQTVGVRLEKHVLYVSLPTSDWDVKMGIVSRHHVKDESCRAVR